MASRILVRQATFALSSLLALCASSCAPPTCPAAAPTLAASAPSGPAAGAAHKVSAPTDVHLLDLARIEKDPPLAGRAPRGFSFSRDGHSLAFLKGSASDSKVLDLWSVPLPGGTPSLLVKASDLVDAHHVKLTEEQRMEQERKRIKHLGITSFSWCGPGADHLLFPLGASLYDVRIEGGKRKVKTLGDSKSAKLDPSCSPKGSFVTFIRKGDLFIIDVTTGRERRLTRGATKTHTRGLSEFVAQEEMDRFRGYWWSPDERYLAYLDVDTSPVKVKVRPRIYADRTELFNQRYPAAGEANAIVRLKVLDVKTGREKEIRSPYKDGYLARVNWSPKDAHLWVQWEARDQTKVSLLEASAPKFKVVQAFVEQDNDWVDLHKDLRILRGGDELLWSSERSGVRRLYLAKRIEQWKMNPLSTSTDPLVRVVGVDPNKRVVYVVRQTKLSREKQLFAVSLDGKSERQVTKEAGWHQVVVDKASTHFIDTFSSFAQPKRIQLRDMNGTVVANLFDGTKAPLQAFTKPEVSWVKVTAADGKTPLNGVLIHPLGQQPGERYPVIVYTYAGPQWQVATNAYHSFYPLDLYLAQHGYGVFMLDGRGSGGRDRSFSRSIHYKLGQVEIDDQIAGAKYLAGLPWVDANRIGIWGWSYGGYASLMAILRKDTPFAAAAAVAPVTDWTLYDTHYTERYLGTPQKHPDAYKHADVLAYADNLKRPLLIQHGMADDNVLFENSLRLISHLENKATPFDLMIYPGRAHSLKGRGTRLHVYRTLVRFFDRTIKAKKSTESSQK